MPSIETIRATTETEALNIMLSAIGEAPVAAIDTAAAADAVIAKNILREVTAEILEEGWRFNTEFGYELAPTVTQAWVGSDGTTATLNVFERPANLARCVISDCRNQAGTIDMVERQGGSYDPTKTIFYDRLKNRDGLDSTRHTVLYIDPVWYFDFEKCPATIRRLITVVAARRLAMRATNSEALAQFTEDAVMSAYRSARRDQGTRGTFTMLQESSVRAIRGTNRALGPSGRITNFNSPRKV